MVLTTTHSVPTPIGESAAFQDMLAHVSRLAPLDRPVLVVGERGTGKELIASRLNYLSGRWDRPFVKVNCAAIPESLLDSELFGHEAGAFTGAIRRRPGRFELADSGTLLLDEIATASASVQEKLLRVIEYQSFERVGSSEPIQVDVRVIAATNADLPALATAGKFRSDLLDRLAFDVITLPPLRTRPDDILLLAEHFATRMTAELRRDYFAGFAARARDCLLGHPWPGNVRELRNAVERSVCRMTRPDRDLEEIVLDPFARYADTAEAKLPNPEAVESETLVMDQSGGNLRDRVRRFEASLVRNALIATRYNQRRAAERLGLSYDQLRHVLRSNPDLRDVRAPAA